LAELDTRLLPELALDRSVVTTVELAAAIADTAVGKEKTIVGVGLELDDEVIEEIGGVALMTVVGVVDEAIVLDRLVADTAVVNVERVVLVVLVNVVQ